ncbi:MAG: class I SAM-dependent methyltransferase [Actinomycetota bacterium]
MIGRALRFGRFLLRQQGLVGLVIGVVLVAVGASVGGWWALVSLVGAAIIVVALLRRLDAIDADRRRTSDDVASLRQNAEDLGDALERVDRRTTEMVRDLERLIGDEGPLQGLMQQVSDVAEGLHESSEAQRRQADAIINRLRGAEVRVTETNRRMERLLGIQSAAHDRDLDDGQLQELLDYWNPRLGVSATPRSSAYVLQRMRQLEAMSVGRLATRSSDVLIRCYAAESARSDDVEICEIGTLFGLGGLIVRDHIAARADQVHLTLIDPLSGYYGEDRLDPATQLPVTRANLERNARLFGVPADELRILEGLSTDDDIRRRADERRYDVMIIDGDHSYDGIRLDFELYADMVHTNGILVIDDYGAEEWPEVTRYTDEVVMHDERFELLGSGSRTAVFRRRDADVP